MAPVSPAGPPPITATSKVRAMAPRRASFGRWRGMRDAGRLSNATLRTESTRHSPPTTNHLLHFSRRQRVQQMQRLAIEIGEIQLRVLGIHDRRTIARRAEAERVADLVAQNFADLAGGKASP